MQTFVVRVWTPAPGLEYDTPVAELHGTLEQIGSDVVRPFRSRAELVALLTAALAPASTSPEDLRELEGSERPSA